jgi:hypothetical protein
MVRGRTATVGGREVGTRQVLALAVVVISLTAVVIVSGLVIGFATPEGKPEATRLVFSSVLPLLGTWVGTVLAFYFARDNLDAATTSTIRLGRSLRPETPVQDVMIPLARITAHRLAVGADVAAVKLSDLLSNMTTSGFQRIPLLTSDDRVVHVVHTSTLSAFAESSQLLPAALTTETMGDLLAIPKFASLVSAIGFIGSAEVVDTARAAMGSVANCNDIFVTSDGTASGVVVGWLTNTDLAGLP